ncbi:4Fe-4S dicluster domain-containing protein [Carboxydochorda subterranea]|uniref:4Fe-4S dicluster domain-containing protein n=1 Tax=Carboxydichorda subterranea TaxID=3109565 RepID=A0ABZ1BVP7_9FIRM|nr:4Fe-4S dicluster domain-containing protein [Limnochorda sp. L945t]WRP16847.1 4Fe-4S dicluster domain-containing protein [Limnochorda sp. L945t]
MPPKRRLLLHFLRSFGARSEPGPALPASRPRLAAGQGPFGAIEASKACTGCTMCAYFCPTGALERREEDGEIVLSHDPSSCTACGLCVDICHRHALRFVEVDPVRAVSGARDVLWRGRFNSPEERLKQAVLQRFSTSV